jgi:uncharacterized membrane protein YphA (DoxX/SURF4 family)
MSERMAWPSSRYPGDAVGVGLLLLRVVTSSYLVYHAVTIGIITSDVDVPVAAAAIGVATLAASVLLLAGLRTPFAACAGAASLIASDWHARLSSIATQPAQNWFNTASFALVTALLIVLGPGTYSLDALFWGSTTIHLSSRDRSRGGKP